MTGWLDNQRLVLERMPATVCHSLFIVMLTDIVGNPVRFLRSDHMITWFLYLQWLESGDNILFSELKTFQRHTFQRVARGKSASENDKCERYFSGTHFLFCQCLWMTDPTSRFDRSCVAEVELWQAHAAENCVWCVRAVCVCACPGL